MSVEKTNYLYRYGPSGLVLESKTVKTFNPSRSNVLGWNAQDKVALTGDRDGTIKAYGLV